MGLTASEKKEQVKAHLKQLRAELRVIHAGVTEEHEMPDPVKLRELMGQMETLLEILEPKSARKKKSWTFSRV